MSLHGTVVRPYAGSPMDRRGMCAYRRSDEGLGRAPRSSFTFRAIALQLARVHRGGSAPPLVVWSEGTDRSLPPGPSYVVGRDPESDIVITDARVSWRHAVLRLEDGRWVLTDDGSTNGTY